MSLLVSLLSFIVAIGLLVTVHEFGHFWVARRLGIRVLRFSIGFGKPIWQRTGRDGVEYVIGALPLGGYVKMLDEREGEVPAAERDQAFNRQPVAKRMAVAIAGPLFNFIFAILAYWLIYAIGVPGTKPVIQAPEPETPAAVAGLHAKDRILAVGSAPTPTWETAGLELMETVLGSRDVSLQVESQNQAPRDVTLHVRGDVSDLTEPGQLLPGLGLKPWMPPLAPVIGSIQDGQPAAQAGLQAGDRVVSIDGKAIDDWRDLQRIVSEHPGDVLDFRIQRDGQTIERSIAIASMGEGDQVTGHLGVGPKVPDDYGRDLRAVEQYGPGKAFVVGARKTWDVSLLTLKMLGRMVIGQASLKNISGPINIAQYAGATAQIGLVPFLGFLAVISVSLGILNLLPIPILDGGHLLFYVAEAVKGSPVSERTEELGQRIGIAVLVLVMGLAMYNDLARLITG